MRSKEDLKLHLVTSTYNALVQGRPLSDYTDEHIAAYARVAVKSADVLMNAFVAEGLIPNDQPELKGG